MAEMKELRVYVNPLSANAPEAGRATFYSRRADGPFYRWLYESGRWRASRVVLPKQVLRVLCVASWKAVPDTLQTRLGEHYLE